MIDENMKGKIKKVVDNPVENIEKGAKKGWEAVKDFGEDVKDSEPAEAIEKGVKKGWDSVKDFGENIKESVTKMVKKGGKK